MDYKEIFQQYYDEAIDEGQNEEAAGKYAEEMLYDFFASIADNRPGEEG